MKNVCKRVLGNTGLFVLLFVLLVVTCFAQSERTSDKYFKQEAYARQVSEYYKSIPADCKGKSFDCVIAHFTKMIESDPNDALAYFLRGRFSFYAKKNDEAIQDLSRTIELLPEYKETYNNLGLAYIQKEDYEKAIDVYTKVIALTPQASLYYSHRGMAYRNKGDFEKALADYNKAIVLNPGNDQPYGLRAFLYVSWQKNYEKALADYNKAIELAPDDWRHYYSRGNLYSMMGEQEKSAADQQKAKELKEVEEKR